MEKYVTHMQTMVTEKNSRVKAQREAKAQKDLRERQARLKHLAQTQTQLAYRM